MIVEVDGRFLNFGGLIVETSAIEIQTSTSTIITHVIVTRHSKFMTSIERYFVILDIPQ